MLIRGPLLGSQQPFHMVFSLLKHPFYSRFFPSPTSTGQMTLSPLSWRRGGYVRTHSSLTSLPPPPQSPNNRSLLYQLCGVYPLSYPRKPLRYLSQFLLLLEYFLHFCIKLPQASETKDIYTFPMTNILLSRATFICSFYSCMTSSHPLRSGFCSTTVVKWLVAF